MTPFRRRFSAGLVLCVGLTFPSGCAGVHKRPSLFPNRVDRVTGSGAIGSPKVELRPPSMDLPADPAPALSPLNAPMDLPNG